MLLLEKVRLKIMLVKKFVSDFVFNSRKWREWSGRAGGRVRLRQKTLFQCGFYRAIWVDGKIQVIGAPTSGKWRNEVRLFVNNAPVVFEDASKVIMAGYTRIEVSCESAPEEIEVRLWRWVKRIEVERYEKIENQDDSILMVTLCQSDIQFVSIWKSHYESLGVTDFLIGYNGFDNQLTSELRSPDVLLWAIPYHLKSYFMGKLDVHFAQPAFLQYALYFAKAKGFEWIAAFDVDEFIAFPEQIDLRGRRNDEMIFQNVWAFGDLNDSVERSLFRISMDENSVNRTKAIRRSAAIQALPIHGSGVDIDFDGAFVHLERLSGGTSMWRSNVSFEWTEVMGWREIQQVLQSK